MKPAINYPKGWHLNNIRYYRKWTKCTHCTMYCSLENVGNDFSEPLKINNSWGLGTCIPLTLLKFALFHLQNLHSNEYCVTLVSTQNWVVQVQALARVIALHMSLSKTLLLCQCLTYMCHSLTFVAPVSGAWGHYIHSKLVKLYLARVAAHSISWLVSRGARASNKCYKYVYSS